MRFRRPTCIVGENPLVSDVDVTHVEANLLVL